MHNAISDLFFMLDNSAYFNDEIPEDKREQDLEETAEQFVFLINRFSAEEPVTVEQVIADYKARL